MLNALDGPWRAALLLGWEAYEAGTIPVGAVVVDGSGAIVAEGRNRIFDTAGEGSLGGSRLAHAEVNALVQLPSSGTHERLTLYTLLEPCHLCLGAAYATRVGRVRYAAPDPWGGAARLLVPSEDHRAHPLAIEGPSDGMLGRLGELLHVAHFLWRVPDSNVAAFYRRTRPDLVEAAAALPAPGSGASLEAVLGAVT